MYYVLTHNKMLTLSGPFSYFIYVDSKAYIQANARLKCVYFPMVEVPTNSLVAGHYMKIPNIPHPFISHFEKPWVVLSKYTTLLLNLQSVSYFLSSFLFEPTYSPLYPHPLFSHPKLPPYCTCIFVRALLVHNLCFNLCFTTL